ncbi:MAG: hypothetical protein WA213_20860 [Terriglobales bacterium]
MNERIVTVRDAGGKCRPIRVPKTGDWIADHIAALDLSEKLPLPRRIQ